MEEDKIRQQARKLINEKYPYLPFKEWGYFEDMFINGWKEALIIQRVSQQRELFDAILDFSEELPMCTEDYHRSELWEKYKALNCG